MCKTFSKNIMAILLVVLPNSTILDPSKPKTCPTLRWNHLADAPSRSSLGKAVLYLIQALMNAVPVQFQRSKWRHLLSSSPTQSGSGFPAPCRGWKQPRGRRVLSCSWSGTFFSPELHNPKWNVHLPLFLLLNACRRLGVCYCAVPTQ